MIISQLKNRKLMNLDELLIKGGIKNVPEDFPEEGRKIFNETPGFKAIGKHKDAGYFIIRLFKKPYILWQQNTGKI